MARLSTSDIIGEEPSRRSPDIISEFLNGISKELNKNLHLDADNTCTFYFEEKKFFIVAHETEDKVTVSTILYSLTSPISESEHGIVDIALESAYLAQETRGAMIQITDRNDILLWYDDNPSSLSQEVFRHVLENFIDVSMKIRQRMSDVITERRLDEVAQSIPDQISSILRILGDLDIASEELETNDIEDSRQATRPEMSSDNIEIDPHRSTSRLSTDGGPASWSTDALSLPSTSDLDIGNLLR